LTDFLNALRELATSQLVTAAWPKEASLKYYVLCLDPDWEAVEFFQTGFPDELQLRHAYQMYHLLKAIIADA